MKFLSRTLVTCILTACVWCLACGQPLVRLGNDIVVDNHLAIFKGKRVGLVCNHTSRVASRKHLADALLERGVSVVALFGPEHGVRGLAEAGEKVIDTTDEKTGIPVFSLYGKSKKPTQSMLANVDILVYDIQDVGVRYYTYISTMGLCMEAAAEKGIPFVVLDRPNPLGGTKIDGPIIDDSLKSFVGMFSIPIVYGLTCGELATMINEERWLANKVHCDLTVIPMKGWKRTMTWRDTGLEWIAPSPNIRTPDAALVYPVTCFFEATNVSEGRGTDSPFQMIGAPFLDGVQLQNTMRGLNLKGVRFESVAFVPTSSKFKGERCKGIRVEVTDWQVLDPVAVNLHLLAQARGLFLKQMEIRETSLNRLLGSRAAYLQFRAGMEIDSVTKSWSQEIKNFRASSAKYFLY